MAACFIEDDNFVEMGLIEEQRKEFPTPSEEENDEEDEEKGSESEDEVELQGLGRNNNATGSRRPRPSSALGSWKVGPLPSSSSKGKLPDSSEPAPMETEDECVADPEVSGGSHDDTFSLIQDYMIKKGIIQEEMGEEELNLFLRNEMEAKQPAKTDSHAKTSKEKDIATPSDNREEIGTKSGKTNTNRILRVGDINESTSEITVYRRAVPILEPDVDRQITRFIKDVRNREGKDNRKFSSSLDEIAMDTSDESDMLIDPSNFIADKPGWKTPKLGKPGTSRPQSQEEVVEDNLRKTERNKAVMYEVPGRPVNFSTGDSMALMDQDYQMIDAHVDEQMKKRIQCFEYVDFSKLIVKGRSSEEQRLELVSKNGMTFLSPVADRDTIQINSYLRWEQAFRIYSNIVTARFPQKSTELLQYNHTIHTASMSYN